MAPRRHHDRRSRFAELIDRLRIEVVSRVISYKDEVGEFGPRQISCAPRIDVNHCAGVFHLDASVEDRHEEDIAALGADPIRGLRRQWDEAHQEYRRRNGQAHGETLLACDGMTQVDSGGHTVKRPCPMQE